MQKMTIKLQNGVATVDVAVIKMNSKTVVKVFYAGKEFSASGKDEREARNSAAEKFRSVNR